MAIESRHSQNDRPFVPLYKKLTMQYRNSILKRELKSGNKIDSINEIQQRHDVSRETAKIVLKNLAKEGLIIKKRGMGSFVADLGPREKKWAIIIPFYSLQYEALINSIMVHAENFGRKLDFFIDHNDWEEEIRLVGELINQRYESIIVSPTLNEHRTSSHYRDLSRQEADIILIDHTQSGSFFSYVIQSYDLGVKRGLYYLLEANKGNLLFLNNEVWAENSIIQKLMEETFLNLLQDEGSARQAFIVNGLKDVSFEYIRSNNITGIFSCDDSIAIRAIGKLSGEGARFPEDCRLVSYGNTDLARYFTPAITSIDPMTDDMAEKTVSIIKSRIEKKNTEYCQYVVQPELHVRQT